MKCRFSPVNLSNKEIKLEDAALQYIIAKSAKSLYCDIIVEDFIEHLKPTILEKLGHLAEG